MFNDVSEVFLYASLRYAFFSKSLVSVNGVLQNSLRNVGLNRLLFLALYS